MSTVLHVADVVGQIVTGTTANVPFVVSRDDMARFASLSGDFNPLHADDLFARQKGFDGTVVYGALLIAKVSQLIGMRLPGRDAVWLSVAMDFVKPLYVDQRACVHGLVTHFSASTGMVELKLKICSAAEQVLAKGRAEVLIVH